MKTISSRWNEVLTPYCKNERWRTRVWNEIVWRYAEKHRHYHTLEHVQFMVDQVDRFGKPESKTAMILAAIFHDVVYYPGSVDNEIHSAEYADKQLHVLGVEFKLIQQVIQLILSTAYTNDQDNRGEMELLFMDIDHLIMGQNRTMYQSYRRGIEKEFSHYPKAMYVKGRVAFLEGLLKRERLFYTPELYSLFNDAAVLNVILERNDLSTFALQVN